MWITDKKCSWKRDARELDWIEQCFTSPPTQNRLYFYRSKNPTNSIKVRNEQIVQTNQTYNKQTWTQNTASPLVYNNMGWRLPQTAGLPGLNGGGAANLAGKCLRMRQHFPSAEPRTVALQRGNAAHGQPQTIIIIIIFYSNGIIK